MNFRRRLPITFLVAAASIINAASVAGAVTIQNQQGEDIYLELRNRAVSPVTLAVPTFSIISGAEGEANILRQVLWNDLDYSMVFDLVDSEFYPNIESGDGPPDFTAWRQTSAEALIRGFVRRQGDDLTVEFRLYDVASGQQIIGKHNGRLDVHSEMGVGTTFTVKLPLKAGDTVTGAQQFAGPGSNGWHDGLS